MSERFQIPIGNYINTSDRVCETLRRAIILKVLKPGERLVEAKIAKELNVSITPVRHAFSRLTKEGLINIFPFKGSYVVEVTSKFVAEVGTVRKMLEIKAAELAFPHLTAEDCNKLRLYVQQMQDAHQKGCSLYEINELDILFHQYFFERSDNMLLLEMWDLMKPRIHLLQSYGRVNPIPEGRIYSRHMKIVDAILTGNVETFCASIEEHLESGHMMIKDYLNVAVLE